MSDPLTTDDLYGPSKPEEVKSVVPEKPLEFEETPIIIPVDAESPKLSPPHELPKMPTKPTGSVKHTTGTVVAFLLLFIAGIWLSSSLRQFLPSGLGTALGLPEKKNSQTPTPSIKASPSPASLTAGTEWKTYLVMSGITKKPIDGIEFQLPSGVLEPICDGVGCASQGTFLPGGTRFTIAPRGTGQSLRDFRGSTISDVNGISFTSKQVSMLGRQSVDFTGVFTGRTISGYSFSKMRGIMIPVTDTVSLEINHFTPSGITADFASDDVLFDEILTKLSISAGLSTEKGAVLTSVTPTGTPTKIASPTATVSVTKTPTPTGIK